jgi:hypothetical protein
MRTPLTADQDDPDRSPDDGARPQARRRGLLARADRLSWRWLLLLAPFVLLAPWPGADTPHLVEKLQMLSSGTLTRPLDVFDLFYHAAPIFLLSFKALATMARRRTAHMTSAL